MVASGKVLSSEQYPREKTYFLIMTRENDVIDKSLSGFDEILYINGEENWTSDSFKENHQQ